MVAKMKVVPGNIPSDRDSLSIKNHGEAWVFVGCGGTFWTSTPFLSQLVNRRVPSCIKFIDPDWIEPKNLSRQWCPEAQHLAYHGIREGDLMAYKAILALNRVAGRNYNMNHGEALTLFHSEFFDAEAHLFGIVENTLHLVVNVDCDHARLACVKAAQEYEDGRVIVYMTGCDEEFGQVYYGIWEDGDPVHNFLPLHTDIGNGREAPERPKCGEQTVLSNQITGTLLARAIEHVLKRHILEGNYDEFLEFYWAMDEEKGLRTWQSVVKPLRQVSEITEEDINTDEPVAVGGEEDIDYED